MRRWKITTIVETEDSEFERDIRLKINTDLNRGDGLWMDAEKAEIEFVERVVDGPDF